MKDQWAHTSVQDRAAILFKIADRMEQNLELLATAETSITVNRSVKPVRRMFRWRSTTSVISLPAFVPEGGISEVDSDTVAYHFHEPLGVVGQIIPWNFPY